MSESTPKSPKVRRRWTSISLRGLMLLVLVVGGSMGWKARKVSLQRRAVTRVKAMGGAVVYDWEYGGHAYLRKPGASPPGPVWLRNAVGDDYLQAVAQVNVPAALQLPPALKGGVAGLEKWSEANKAFKEKHVKPIADDQLACLEAFDGFESLSILESFPLKPEGLDRLGRLTHLKELHVGKNFEDGGMARLGSLTKLEILSIQLFDDQPTDLSFLAKLPRLRSLTVGGLTSGDGYLEHVGQARSLKFLTLLGHGLTDEGLSHLKDLKSLENLAIFGSSELTGEGLVALEGLSNLETLLLPGLPMDKAGLGHLRKLTRLKILNFTRGKLDTETLDEFKAARPGVSISFTPTFNFQR